MNLVKLQQKLIAAAREQQRTLVPDERVPLAFEKRITALIAARALANRWTVWSEGLWRSAISCAAIAMICGVWFMVNREAPASNDLSQDFENTLLASVDQSDLSQ
jgi:anti-sigma-K factor RskA